MLKRHLLFALSVVLFSACHENKIIETSSLFNDEWQFFRCDSVAEPISNSYSLETFDDSKWLSVTLPHTPRIEPVIVNDQWQGECWYRKSFVLADSLKGRRLFLEFEAAMNDADIWLNGHKVKSHIGGYLPFNIDISRFVYWNKKNVLAVRLNNEDNALTGPKPLKDLDFNTYGGLYRNVRLVNKAPVYITDANSENEKNGGGVFFHADNISSQKAKLEASLHVRNSLSDEVTVQAVYTFCDDRNVSILSFRSEKKKLTKDSTIILNGSEILNNPKLWSVSSPNLYTLKVRLLTNGRQTDQTQVRVGIRAISITKEGLWLNGQKTFLRGVNRHQEYPYVGYALSDNAQYRDAYLIKQAGFDYVRCSHYPPSPAFLDACDELGIMVMDAVLGWQYFGDDQFAEQTLSSCRQLIRRDRNHPSVLTWELSINEAPMPERFMKRAHRIAHEEYPFNDCYSAGWIKGDYDVFIQARQHRHDLDYSKPLIVSEYGDWEYYAQNAGFNQTAWSDLKSEERSSRQARNSGETRLLQQARNVQEAHNDNLSTHAFADGYWAMFDYNRGYSDDLEQSGLMDIFRLPKYACYFFQSQRSAFERPVLFIASEWTVGRSKGVRVFSNCEEVELYVDGKLIARHWPDKDEFSTNLNHPPFSFNVDCLTPGKVEAVGYINKKEVIRREIQTALEPEKLQLSCPYNGKDPQAGCNDLLFVYANVVDKNGTTTHQNGLLVRFGILEGDAEIIGDTIVSADAGVAAILLRIGNSRSPIKISANGNGVKSDVLILEPK